MAQLANKTATSKTAMSKTVSTSRRIRRRSVVAGLCAGALAPFIPRLNEVTAQSADAVRRLVLVFSPNGTIYDDWRPRDDDSFGPILEPLEPLRDKLVVLDALNMVQGPGDNHQEGISKLWTGCDLEGNDIDTGPKNTALAAGPSLDQTVAEAIGTQTAYRSLEFAVRPGDAGGLGLAWHRMVYAGPSQPIAPERDPYAMFDRLFDGRAGLDESALEQIRRERQSVIDQVRGELQSLSGIVGQTDRHKLEAHLDAIRSIETRLISNAATCDPSVLEAETQDRMDPESNNNFPTIVRLQSDLLALALRCDLTRVATLQWSHSVGGERHSWVQDGANNHHGASHEDAQENVAAYLTLVNRWYAEQFGYLLQQLDAVPEADGSLLDNSIVAYGNELGRGSSHSLSRIPFVLAGGAGGRISTGRVLRFDGEEHNRLLVSLGQAMGLDIESFGNVDKGNGALPGLLG